MKWLIDGHNLIGHMPDLRLDDPDDEEKLLEHLRRYRARTGHGLTVVFDAGPVYHSGRMRKIGGITVQFAALGQTADQIIIRRLGRIKNPQASMVVSSDHAVQQAARQAQVRVVDSREFAQQLLPTPPSNQDEGSQADIHLSPDEVNEWLDLFNKGQS